MNILGTGIDIVEIARMEQILKRWDRVFLNRVFLAEEQSYCDSRANPAVHYAGRFAVKEAVSKAFGTGMGPHLGWRDIQTVRNKKSGAPSIKLSSAAQNYALKQGVKNIHISLSHTHQYAVAHAIITDEASDRRL